MAKTERIQNMTKGSPAKLIFTFAIPLMLGNVFQQFYTVVDTAIVGQALGVNALAALGATADEAVMIGDRYTDIDGAHACNLDAIGCRWGYAPAGEMEEHGAYEILEKPEQIEEAVNRYFQTH